METGGEVIEVSLLNRIGEIRDEVEKFTKAASKQIEELILAEAAELEDIFPEITFRDNDGLPVQSKGVVLDLLHIHNSAKEIVLTPKGIFICSSRTNTREGVLRWLPALDDIENPTNSYPDRMKWLDYGEKAAKALEFMRFGRFTTDEYGRLEFEGL